MGPLGAVLGNLSACQKCWFKRWVLCHARAELRARDLGKQRVIASPRALGVRGSEDGTWDFENLARGTACSSPRGEPLPARRSCLLQQGWASWLSYPAASHAPLPGKPRRRVSCAPHPFLPRASGRGGSASAACFRGASLFSFWEKMGTPALASHPPHPEGLLYVR